MCGLFTNYAQCSQLHKTLGARDLCDLRSPRCSVSSAVRALLSPEVLYINHKDPFALSV